MKTIHKYHVSPFEDHIDLPQGARPLSVQMQRGEIQLWALVLTDVPFRRRQLVFVGTGHDAAPANGLDYIGTVQLNNGALVLHVFLEADPGL